MTVLPKRLIEVDLPIKRISAHARREKSIRHGHISTLHIWWARRPLAACRAVICAALWPDPADPNCPDEFRAIAADLMYAWARENAARGSAESAATWTTIRQHSSAFALCNHPMTIRYALLDFIADFANWDNSKVEEYLSTARTLTTAANWSLEQSPPSGQREVGWPGLERWADDISQMRREAEAHRRPLIVDPFAGGGSIPLEALRVGADAFASDLNPVPVLINKVVLEYIPKYGQRLVDEVRKWGAWIKRESEKELFEFYPKDADGAMPMAYLWARTVLSEAPSSSGIPIQVPLLRTLWLSKRKDFKRALRWARDARAEIKTSISEISINGRVTKVRIPLLEIFEPVKLTDVEAGTALGGSATCPITKHTTPAGRVKEQLKQQRGGAQNSRLYALYVERTNGREFRVATQTDSRHFQAAVRAYEITIQEKPDAFPTEPINPIRPYKNTRGLSAVTRIGCLSFGDLYNRRQALAIQRFYAILVKLSDEAHGMDGGLLKAVQTTLAFAVNRGVSQNTSMSRWDASRLTIKGAFSKQALAVVWDFAEANPFSGGSADWDGAIEWVTKFIESNAVIRAQGTVVQASATHIPLPSDSAAALITDPPYFAAIPYGDLSDFFYVWFRRGLGEIYPELFSGQLTAKEDELIVTNAQKAKGERLKDTAVP